MMTPTALPGVFVLDIEPVHDERGFFARIWSREELEARGLVAVVKHSSLSFNRAAGTLRGMHYQAPPFEEVKIVRCTRGAAHDVVLDLRRSSPGFGRWVAVTLSAENRRSVYIPAGCAHGFQTLVADTEMHYQISEVYAPEFARGVRWDDPAFGIVWPEAERTISARDRAWPDFVR